MNWCMDLAAKAMFCHCSVIVCFFNHFLYSPVSWLTVLVARELQQFAREWLEEQGMDYDATCQPEMTRQSVILMHEDTRCSLATRVLQTGSQ